MMILILLISLALSTRAQENLANARIFTTSEGLSNDQVLALLQDSEGFIWIGTKYGLHRFDGHRFRVFTKEGNGLQSNIINLLEEGPNGSIWAMRYQEAYGRFDFYSIDILDPLTGQVRSFEDLVTDAPFTRDQIRYVNAIDDGLIFRLSDDRVYRMDREYQLTPVVVPREFRFINLTKDGKIFCETDKGYVIVTLDGEEVLRLQVPGDVKINHMAEDGFANYWCIGAAITDNETVNPKGLMIRFDAQGRIISRTNNDQISWINSRLYSMRNGRAMIIVNANNIQEYDLSGDSIKSTEKRLPVRAVIFPADMIVDRNNALWIGDYFGLRVIDLETTRFKTWLNRGEKKYSARGITLIDDRLLVMSESGPREINIGTGEIRPIMGFLDKLDILMPFPIHQTKDGRIIIATSALIELDRDLDIKTISKTEFPDKLRLWNFSQMSDGLFWAAANVDDIIILEEDLGSWRFFEKYNGFDDLRGTFKWQFLEDGDHIWIPAQNGLYLIHKEKGIIAQFGANLSEGNYLPAIIFHHIRKEAPGKYWLSTGDGGLIRFECDPAKPDDFSFIQYDKEDGLPSNELYASFQDERGNLWISSANGLIRFDPVPESVMVYSEDQGIANNEFNRLSYYQHSDGRLFFGGINGVTSFNPVDMYDQEDYRLPIKVSAAYIFSMKSDTLRDVLHEIATKGTLVLHPRDNFLNLEFSLQDYYFSKLARYSYRIPGILDNWTTMKDNTVQLAGLPYGNHSMEIRASGRMNRTSELPLILRIQVARPFYLQWWFIVLALITGALTVWQYTSWRNRSLIRRKAVLEEMIAERTRKIEEDKELIEAQAEQLRELDVMKSRFFENVSHELRTPLTLILGPLDKVLKRNKLENQDFTLLSLMKDNAARLHKRINELLDLSRIDAVRMTVHSEPVKLYLFVKRILAQFEGAARMKNVGLSYEFRPDQNIRVLIDPDKLEKILYNLLSNALKFTPEGGTITLSCTADQGLIMIRVRDTGIGIPKEDLPRIFDRFHRARTDDHYEGTGIGLALCRELTELMGGTISAESESGKGSTFEVKMPLVETFDEIIGLPPDEEMTDISELAEGIVDITGEPILVVEDNPSLREYLRITLADFHVKTAGDGREALQVLDEGFRPALIITDVMMPVMDGMQLLQAIRESEHYGLLPVIMLTAKSGSMDRIEALRVGVDDYLTKPFVEEELVARVHALIRNSRNRIGAEGRDADQDAGKGGDQAPVTRADLKWLEEVESLIMRHIGDQMFGIDQLAEKLHMSTRRVQQKIKAITGMTPKQYQREIQLEAARRLLESGDVQSVSEVSHQMGFSDTHYFSKLYENRFGKRPSDYL